MLKEEYNYLAVFFVTDILKEISRYIISRTYLSLLFVNKYFNRAIPSIFVSQITYLDNSSDNRSNFTEMIVKNLKNYLHPIQQIIDGTLKYGGYGIPKMSDILTNQIERIIISNINTMYSEYSDKNYFKDQIKMLKKLKEISSFPKLPSNSLYLILTGGPDSFPNLKVLDFPKNDIRFLDNLSSYFPNIEKVHFNGNKIGDIDVLVNTSTHKSIPSLKVLNLCHNKIQNIPDNLFDMCPNLEKLYVYGNPIGCESIIKILENPHRLRKFRCGRTNRINRKNDSEILNFPDNFSTQNTLTTLRISNYELSNIEFLKFFPNIQSLDLSNNKISDPEPIGHLTKIKMLDVYCNIISDTSFLSQLDNLTFLDISRNPICEFNNNFKNMKKLEEIRADNCNINFIPKSLFGLMSITKLAFPKNNIESLPEDICKLKILTHLDLSDNLIKKFPDNFCPKYLKELYLNLNGFSEFPTCIPKMQSLEVLDISGNYLREIPDNLHDCSILHKLFFGDCLIQNISPNIVNLKYLEKIEISNNKIWGIPDYILELPKSCEIIMYGNRIHDCDIGYENIYFENDEKHW